MSGSLDTSDWSSFPFTCRFERRLVAIMRALAAAEAEVAALGDHLAGPLQADIGNREWSL